jgi:hypothetical protein
MVDMLNANRRPSRMSLVLFGMILLLNVYVLVPGPLFRYGPEVLNDRVLGSCAVAFIPIFWTCDRSEAVAGLYAWYFDLWGVPFSNRETAPTRQLI